MASNTAVIGCVALLVFAASTDATSHRFKTRTASPNEVCTMKCTPISGGSTSSGPADTTVSIGITGTTSGPGDTTPTPDLTDSTADTTTPTTPEITEPTPSGPGDTTPTPIDTASPSSGPSTGGEGSVATSSGNPTGSTPPSLPSCPCRCIGDDGKTYTGGPRGHGIIWNPPITEEARHGAHQLHNRHQVNHQHSHESNRHASYKVHEKEQVAHPQLSHQDKHQSHHGHQATFHEKHHGTHGKLHESEKHRGHHEKHAEEKHAHHNAHTQ